MLALIEINDAGLLTFLGENLVSESPGYAVVHDNRLFVGTEAFRSNRLYPHWTNSRFWQHLDTEPIKNPQPQVRHNADLAFAHLEQVWTSIKAQADEVVLSLSSGISRQQIGLLLGIARECGIPVTGIVDSAIINARKIVTSRQSIYLDIHLHQISLSLMSRNDHLTTEKNLVVHDTGLARMWDRWANTIATLFIQNTRFDPMHDAGSEQMLYDRIPSWIKELGDSSTCEFELEWSGNKHKITFSPEKLVNASAELYPAIVQQVRQLAEAGSPVQLLVSHRFRGFPGLRDSLALLKDCEVIQLDPMVTLQTAIECIDQIRSPTEQLTYVTRLPVSRDKINAHPAVMIQGSPTHLLYEDLAVPIERVFKLAADWSSGLIRDDSEPLCTIYFRGDTLILKPHGRSELTLNNAQVRDEQTLHTGDVIGSGNAAIRLIRVQATSQH